MKRLLFASVALLFAAGAALGQSATFIYTPLGFQQLTVTSASSIAPTVPLGSRVAEICVENNPVRYRDDGPAPTTTVGVPVAASQCYQYSVRWTNLAFIAVSTSAVLDLAYYQ